MQRFELDLSSFRLQSGGSLESADAAGRYADFMNSTVQGREVACLNCDPDLFREWVAQARGTRLPTGGGSPDDAASPNGRAGTQKHPNAPQYDKWAKGKNGVSSLLRTGTVTKGSSSARPGPHTAAEADAQRAGDPGIQLHAMRDWDLEAAHARLQTLWAERRLVVGGGPNPLRQRMDFTEVLVSLGRNAPLLTPDCDGELGGRAPHCASILSGLHRTASSGRLRRTLTLTFGAPFLKNHTFDAKWSLGEQRAHVRAVLARLKESFTFYHQKCLAREQAGGGAGRSCASSPSALVGQIACRPEEDSASDDCVYAELRRCEEGCGGDDPRGRGGDGRFFFEYARFHGPIALFDTRYKRDRLMGQCEEFSRAGHALLAALGYEVRYVLDFTDHVWLEVRLPRGERGTWLHADPSEGVLDSPLMYETGWGKQLTMIFAFTPWSVEHVTQRYTRDYKATVARRFIPEESLRATLEEANSRLQYELPMRSWGYGHKGGSSRARTLKEVLLWAHFEGRAAAA